MCGISGLILNKKTMEKKILLENNKIMNHRGPDGKGIWISKDKTIGFSHVRLSIVDLDKRATQPMHLANNTITITFNGEIYNYKKLRIKLEKKYSFNTTSDTEVLGYLYKEKGIKMLQDIEGMFSFAIYDKTKDEIFLARDIVGQKPLIYHEGKEGFYFASEIPVLLNMKPKLEKTIDYTALRLFLSDKFSHIPQPFTAYKHIKKLKPAHYIRVKKGKIIEYKQYFKLQKQKQTKQNEIEIIENTIKNMKPTDVQYASFLSGGIDSSLVCSILQKTSKTPVETYTLTTKKEDLDYLRSKLIAKKLGLKQHKITFNQNNVEKNISEELKILGEPYYHITTIYSDQILNEVKKKHKVIFTGSGGDEVYYGYNNQILILLDLFLKIKKRIPKNFLKFLLPPQYKYLSNINLKNAKKILYLESYNKVKAFPDKEDLGEKYITQISKDINNFAEINNFIELSYVSGLIVENSHSLTIPADLAGMKHSIEIRNPFLEKKLIIRGHSIPLFKKTKITRLKEGKEILRKALLKTFPKKFIYSKKYGFGTELKNNINRRRMKMKIVKEFVHKLT